MFIQFTIKSFLVDLAIFGWVQELREGICFFEFICNCRTEEDNVIDPKFEFILTILNLGIIDLVIYKVEV